LLVLFPGDCHWQVAVCVRPADCRVPPVTHHCVRTAYFTGSVRLQDDGLLPCLHILHFTLYAAPASPLLPAGPIRFSGCCFGRAVNAGGGSLLCQNACCYAVGCPLLVRLWIARRACAVTFLLVVYCALGCYRPSRLVFAYVPVTLCSAKLHLVAGSCAFFAVLPGCIHGWRRVPLQFTPLVPING